jgi:hypothetical protein
VSGFSTRSAEKQRFGGSTLNAEQKQKQQQSFKLLIIKHFSLQRIFPKRNATMARRLLLYKPVF